MIGQSWSLGIRAARTLGDADAVEELLAFLDAYPVGHLTVLMRAERDLARARLAGSAGGRGAEELFGKAVAAHRRVGSPYHLAQALLDHAEFLAATGQPDRAETAAAEARALSEALGARPIVDRADAFALMLSGALDLATGHRGCLGAWQVPGRRSRQRPTTAGGRSSAAGVCRHPDPAKVGLPTLCQREPGHDPTSMQRCNLAVTVTVPARRSAGGSPRRWPVGTYGP